VSDIKAIDSGLSAEVIASIQNVFKMHPKISRAILYGSRAKGTYRPNSDIDLTLRADELDYAELVKVENELDDLLLPYTIDLSDYQKIDNPELIAHIDRVGQIFYSK
tara:strand:- start:517 stop:837 length:321 start_codon:yes stop_codon:yes gene_type:complete